MHAQRSVQVAREASERVLGLRPFDVQLIGGIILHEGQIAEMRTGEGKTLVAVLPAYLNALTGKGVHVVTVRKRKKKLFLSATRQHPSACATSAHLQTRGRSLACSASWARRPCVQGALRESYCTLGQTGSR